ncbi:MAG: cysteine dioxygenase family protein [Alphaproteobacteria bacterium]|jgi:predicted metal-dependent enzyme (double-stranded beta helix superfamily)|nr:cysteine dioxygenase family protein [Alphaproteobacteria bacterium]MBT4083815.1 cysteine dioxygenase family protein [Alphaproteobacteria bacterium]MBT4542881.1 cysteine dioxygenase family protein [Alphaproteobacteria bacterium]MBT7744257.1 cysteine dioxygenase family protein [Alphaproteobacteria bacterium]
MSEISDYTLAEYVAELRRITSTTSDYAEIFEQVSPLARKLALSRENWLSPNHYSTNPEQGFTAHLLHEEPDHSLAVFAVAWAPKGGTPPHDHGTWVVVAGVDGMEYNIKYNRLDDRSREGYAELEERCAFLADVGEVICLKPRGIHLVRNDTDEVTVSLHTYGRHFDHNDRTAFDLDTNKTVPLVVDVR